MFAEVDSGSWMAVVVALMRSWTLTALVACNVNLDAAVSVAP